MEKRFLETSKILDKIKDDYYLQEWGRPIPVCQGCFNANGPCGTPCVACERIKAWNDVWIIEMMVFGKYTIYRRKIEGT